MSVQGQDGRCFNADSRARARARAHASFRACKCCGPSKPRRGQIVIGQMICREIKVHASPKCSSLPLLPASCFICFSSPDRGSGRVGRASKCEGISSSSLCCEAECGLNYQGCQPGSYHTGIFLPPRFHLPSLPPAYHKSDKPCRQTIERLQILNRTESILRAYHLLTRPT